jgi:hypothetical protein
MLPYTGVLVVGVTSFSREGANPRSLLRGGVCVLFLLVEVSSLLDVAPASPFIVSKEGLGLHLW